MIKTKGMSKNGHVPPATAEDILKTLGALLSGEQDGVIRKAIVLQQAETPIITIPDSMTKLQASEELHRQWEEEENVINIQRKFDGWKWQDVLVAISITAEEYFGWIDVQQSFFNPPTEVQVVVDYVNGMPVKRTCYRGEFQVRALDSAECAIGISGGVANVVFHIKKKFKKQIEQWFELIDEQLRKRSIYRGKSVSVTSNGAEFGDSCNFEIIETKSNPLIVLNEKERSAIEVYCKIDFSEIGKRTYLFTGNYGNGKTEAAMMLGEEAKRQGMTFFYVKDSRAFINMLSIAAKFYQPAFVFMEDIDEIGSGSDRTTDINALLNTLDGAETKNKNLKVLFTTNHENKINQALRRPGRLDLILKFNNPETETVAEIYRRYFKGQHGAEDINFVACAAATPQNCSGAFVAEISKRALRHGQLAGKLTDEIVLSAIHSMQDQIAFMEQDLPKKPTDIGELLAEKVANRLTGGISVDAQVDLNPIHSRVAEVHDDLKRQAAGNAKKSYDKLDTIKNTVDEIRENQ